MPFSIIRNDITKITADAIVNSANPMPVCGGGAEAAIYAAAGREKLLKARVRIGELEPGEAAATKAFGLRARHIIHTVGPVWQGGTAGELEVLADCYRHSLGLARDLGCGSIAFPLISTGTYGFPKDKALSTALNEIKAFLEKHDMEITIVVFDRSSYETAFDYEDDVKAYIDEKYAVEHAPKGRRRLDAAHVMENRPQFYGNAKMPAGKLSEDESYEALLEETAVQAARPQASYSAAKAAARPEPKAKKKSLKDIVQHVGENFQECLLRLIDERGLTDTAVYKKANLDRKLFSKIRCTRNYTPSKRTAVALAIALTLNLDQTVDLLGRAGIALSPGSKFDLIIEYCIENGIYDIYEINALLFEYGEQLLGC